MHKGNIKQSNKEIKVLILRQKRVTRKYIHFYVYTHIFTFSKYLNAYIMPDTVLGTGNTVLSKIGKIFILMEITFY